MTDNIVKRDVIVQNNAPDRPTSPINCLEHLFDRKVADQCALEEFSNESLKQAFSLDKSNRMTVQVKINEQGPFPFIVDTGSERTVIAKELGKALSLEDGPQLTLATVTGREDVASFMLDDISTDSISVSGIEAPALLARNLGASGLLGIDSLEDHSILMDFKTNEMFVRPSLVKSRNKSSIDGAIVVTARRKAGRLILSDAKIGDLRVNLIIDTGAQMSIGNSALFKRLSRGHRKMEYLPVAVNSVTGDQLIGNIGKLKSINIGRLEIQDLPIFFAESYIFQALGLENKPTILLGMDALRIFDQVEVDFPNRSIAFGIKKGALFDMNRQMAYLDTKPQYK
ncbi:retroviral-like aspartic protease family protein [Sphingorhabdus lutea]|nr:retroviral-like aspartic protease family protein [Sphingorhabdus lutea]